MLGGEREIAPLLGELCQLLMGAEVIRRKFECFGPAGDSLGKRPIDILESLLGG